MVSREAHEVFWLIERTVTEWLCSNDLNFNNHSTPVSNFARLFAAKWRDAERGALHRCEV
jgi:hypothetical protein